MSVGRRLSSSLGCFDDAETAELFSQDSGSTVSATPPRQESPCDRESELYISTSEEEVRRAVQHSPTALPVLQCAPDWLPQRAAEEEEEETRSADNATSATTWAADHVDYLTLFVRWRVSPPLQRHQQQLDNSREWTSTWMPYAAPLSEVFAAAFATKIAAVLHTPNTATTHSSGLDSALSIATNTTIAATHARQAHLTGSAQLPLGRAAFIDYVSVLGGMQEKSSGAERETLGEAAASVSRVHCSVHLHFTADRLKAPCQNEINNIDGNLATVTSPRCHSFDVFAVSPFTTLNGVPLHTHYRYHFRADDVSCCPAGVLSLKLGPRCAVDIALKGLPLFDASELAREHASGSLALHRPPQRLAPQQLRRRSTLAVASTTTTAAAAAAIATTTTTTTSLFASDSTAVLATLSETSEPVALSDTAADDADDVVVESHSSPELLEEVQDDVMPKLTKRQHSTKTATPSRAAKAARPPRHSAAQRKEKTEIEGGEEEREPAAPAPDGKVIFTTGLRLSDSEEDALKALGAIVNPPLRFACYARLLVAQKPLMRSVKLLTVLPYVEEVVHQSWLDTAMHTHSLDIPTESFLYSERRLPGSIESVNNFELRETLRKLPQDRQRLLMGQRFWVHKTTAPQDPPMNDLKTVLTASGGVVTRGIHAANVLVMPQQRPTLKCWRSLLDEMGCGFQVLAQQRQHGLLLVVPDDIFKCVLQQRPLVHSTVHVPRAEPTGLRCRSAKGSSGRASENSSSSNKSNCGAKSKGNGVAPKSGRRSSQGSRKTPRPAASQRSPRPSTRRRSS